MNECSFISRRAAPTASARALCRDARRPSRGLYGHVVGYLAHLRIVPLHRAQQRERLDGVTRAVGLIAIIGAGRDNGRAHGLESGQTLGRAPGLVPVAAPQLNGIRNQLWL